MSTLSMVIRYEMSLFIAGLALVITYQIVIGKINTRGLLFDRPGEFSPGRVQLLIGTLGAAAYYFLQILDSRLEGKFPELPNEFFLILGGSHLLYLGGKLSSVVEERFASIMSRLQSKGGTPTHNSGG